MVAERKRGTRKAEKKRKKENAEKKKRMRRGIQGAQTSDANREVVEHGC